jgi:hypothetical protein
MIDPRAAIGGLADGVVRRAAELVDRVVAAVAPALVQKVLDQLDLTALVRERVDLDEVAQDIDVERIVDRVDLDAIVAKVDIERILDRVDVDAVIARANLDKVVQRLDLDGIVARVDIDRIIARVDLIGLADYVVDGIDLPGIIRESSGSMASEVVRGVRMQGLDADEALARAVGRWLPGRRRPPQAEAST